MDLDLIPIDMLMLIPPKYLAWLVLLFGCPTMLSEALVWLKKLTGKPTMHDSKLRAFWFIVLGWLDVLARNSPMAKCQLEAMQHRQEIETQARSLANQKATIHSMLKKPSE